MSEPEILPFDKFKSFFAPKNIVKVGSVGVYRDLLTITTSNEDTHTLKFDVYVKLKALGIYSNLVEVEIIEITTLNSCDENIENIIRANIPKYIKKRNIKWESQ